MSGDLTGRTEERPDAPVDNAGHGVRGEGAEAEDEHGQRTLGADPRGVRRCVEAATPRMTGGGCAIVNLPAMPAHDVRNHCPAPATSRAAPESFGRRPAAELGPRGIRPNTVAAGLVDSEAVVSLASDPTRAITGTSLSADAGTSPWPWPDGTPPPGAVSPPGPIGAVAPRGARAAPRGAAKAVAVVGMGIAVPGASSPEDFWRLLHRDRNVFAEPDFPLDN